MRLKLLIFLFLGAVFLYFLYVVSAQEGIREGDDATGLSLPDESGQEVHLDQLRGKLVLLNFWATWCPPCIWEIPHFNKLVQQISDPRFVLLGVSVDERGGASINEFRKRVPINFTVLLDPKGESASKYGTYELPQSFLIDPQGKVVKIYRGPREWGDPKVVSEIRQYLP